MPTRNQGSTRRELAEDWAPILTMYLGMAILVFCAIFWALTNRLEPYLLAAAGGTLGTSQGLDAMASLRRPPPQPPPVPDSTVGEGESD